LLVHRWFTAIIGRPLVGLFCVLQDRHRRRRPEDPDWRMATPCERILHGASVLDICPDNPDFNSLAEVCRWLIGKASAALELLDMLESICPKKLQRRRDYSFTLVRVTAMARRKQKDLIPPQTVFGALVILGLIWLAVKALQNLPNGTGNAVG